MNRRTVATVCAMVLGAALTAAVHAESSSAMMGAEAGTAGTMGGPMMDMMMGQGSGMGMMGGPGMMTCPMMGRGLVVSGGPMMAGGHMMGGGPMMGGAWTMGAGIGRFLQIPDLTSEQRQQLVDRGRQLQRQLLQLEGKALEARFALQDAAGIDTPDPKAVGRALQNVYAVRTQMVEATITAANDARGMLTDEQREAVSKRSMGPGAGMSMGGMPARMMTR